MTASINRSPVTSSEVAPLFVLCNPGSEKALKDELARTHPELRFAFSRPGFVTFKSERPRDPRFKLDSVFGRLWGDSLGRIDTVEGFQLPSGLDVKRVQLWAREPGTEPSDEARQALTKITRKLGLASLETPLVPGEPVLTLMEVDPGKPLWASVHWHRPEFGPQPGGLWNFTLPDEAPSRAYLKMAEQVAFGRVPMARDQTVIELGSSPGGMSLRLLEQGLQVIGVDSGEMAPIVAKNPRFRHSVRSADELHSLIIPKQVHWIVMDIHARPDISLPVLERTIAKVPKETLLGAILTLKLSDWKLAQKIPRYLEQLRRMGFADLLARQLPANAQEFSVVALTRKGMLARQEITARGSVVARGE